MLQPSKVLEPTGKSPSTQDCQPALVCFIAFNFQRGCCILMHISRLIYISSIDNYKSSVTFYTCELKQAGALAISACLCKVKNNLQGIHQTLLGDICAYVVTF